MLLSFLWTTGLLQQRTALQSDQKQVDTCTFVIIQMKFPCLCCKQTCSQLSSSEDHPGCASPAMRQFHPKTMLHMSPRLGSEQLPVHDLLLQCGVTMLADPYLIIQVCKKTQLFDLFQLILRQQVPKFGWQLPTQHIVGLSTSCMSVAQ